MNWIPVNKETLVLPVASAKALKLLAQRTYAVHTTEYVSFGDGHKYVFNGVIENHTFKIYLRLKHPENYLPVITGRIEKTSLGCILFIRYDLIFSTRFFLILWSILTILMAFFFFHMGGNLSNSIFALLFGAANYLLTMVNFDRQVKKSRQAIHQIFNQEVSP